MVLAQCIKKGQGGSTVALAVSNQQLVATVRDTGSWGRFEIVEAGQLKIEEAGTHTLNMKPSRKAGNAIMDLRSVILKPVESD